MYKKFWGSQCLLLGRVGYREWNQRACCPLGPGTGVKIATSFVFLPKFIISFSYCILRVKVSMCLPSKRNGCCRLQFGWSVHTFVCVLGLYIPSSCCRAWGSENVSWNDWVYRKPESWAYTFGIINSTWAGDQLPNSQSLSKRGNTQIGSLLGIYSRIRSLIH